METIEFGEDDIIVTSNEGGGDGDIDDNEWD